jgi:IS5 family transposase
MSREVSIGPSLAQVIFIQACPSNTFLEEMLEVVPWERIGAFLKHKIPQKTGGRPPYPLLLLYKMHLLQTWYGLSDEGCEFQVRDRFSFRLFLGLEIQDKVPDASTLEDFRHKLAENGLAEALLAEMDQYFQEKKLILKEGNLIDATFLKANARKIEDEDKKTDVDAEFGHKGYGYSGHTNVDQESKLIRKVATTAANLTDDQGMEPALVGDEKKVYGDKGYDQPKPRKELKKRKIKARILWKRKRGKKGEGPKPLPKRKALLNKAYSKLRARVEHIFGIWKTIFKVTRARYRGLERVNQQFQTLAMAYNLRRLGYLINRKPKQPLPQCA